MPKWLDPLATTQPTPVSLALVMASCMQKVPTTTPKPLQPSTQAVAGPSLTTLGSLLALQMPACVSWTYMANRLRPWLK